MRELVVGRAVATNHRGKRASGFHFHVGADELARKASGAADHITPSDPWRVSRPKGGSAGGWICQSVLSNRPWPSAMVEEDAETRALALVERAIATVGGMGAYGLAHEDPATVLGNTERRGMQARAFVKALRDLELLLPGALYVDLGAGSGHVSIAIREELRGSGTFLLVDQEERPEVPGCMRMKVNLDLVSGLDTLLAAARGAVGFPVVIIANHLCGERAMTFAESLLCNGFVTATCCHHTIAADNYCNPGFFRELGFNAALWDLVCEWSQLAPRRLKPAHTRRNVQHAATRLKLSASACEALGLKCRALIDLGRVRRLREVGYGDAAMVAHVPFAVTADNVMLLGRRDAGNVVA